MSAEGQAFEGSNVDTGGPSVVNDINEEMVEGDVDNSEEASSDTDDENDDNFVLEVDVDDLVHLDFNVA
ncbi:hypothetical protein CCACVL1_08475 [Corchorus capsularis]|uniref:Uncharacterized protein n=1 Tax=Corchorus capsularis TaxID=210143 RepID=A0A1R3J0C8_COCAP|nr:hypothetical protein CCACVL1_08475 [Corchorus capsularis]